MLDHHDLEAGPRLEDHLRLTLDSHTFTFSPGERGDSDRSVLREEGGEGGETLLTPRGGGGGDGGDREGEG